GCAAVLTTAGALVGQHSKCVGTGSRPTVSRDSQARGLRGTSAGDRARRENGVRRAKGNTRREAASDAYRTGAGAAGAIEGYRNGVIGGSSWNHAYAVGGAHRRRVYLRSR